MRYARFVQPTGHSPLERHDNYAPFEGYSIESEGEVYMIGYDDDHLKWARGMFYEKKKLEVLSLIHI